MRPIGFRGMLVSDFAKAREMAVAVELVMQVSRGEGDRLIGSVRPAREADARDFSGTLELMRVFEELVPASGSSHEPSGPAEL